jgi:hypothetical protein
LGLSCGNFVQGLIYATDRGNAKYRGKQQGRGLHPPIEFMRGQSGFPSKLFPVFLSKVVAENGVLNGELIAAVSQLTWASIWVDWKG